MKPLRYNTISRITKTHHFNQQHILTINSALRNLGLTYNLTKSIFKLNSILLNNKTLTHIIQNEPNLFIKLLTKK